MRAQPLRYAIIAVLAAGILSLGACGKSGDKQATSDDGRRVTTKLNPASAPMKSVLEKAGYEPVYYRRFPAQMPGMKANIVVYRAKSGKDGGVLYLQEYGGSDRVVWHWYFDSGVPDSVTALEINGDGLWDVRMYVGGETRDYVQDQSFTFVRSQRDDRVAMNGPSSEPIDAESMSWKCFDGDSTTAWRAKVGSGGAFIVLPTPLGIEDGILSVRLSGAKQPLKCELQVDGNKVQDVDLKPVDTEQLVHLDAEARKARSLRLVVDSGADEVAISELGLK